MATTAMTRRPLTAVEQKQEQAEQEIRLELHEHTRRIVALIGDPDADVAQIQASVLLAVAHNSYLLDCDRATLVLSVLQAARYGVRSFSGPFAGAYLVPFGKKITPIISYKYLVDVAQECGATRMLKGEAVYDGDRFDYQEGTGEFVQHRKALRGGKRVVDTFLCAYGKAILPSGDEQFTILTYEDVMTIRNDVLAKIQATQYKSAEERRAESPWVKSFDRMAAKTAVRRLANYIGLNPDRHNRLVSLIEADDKAGRGLLTDQFEEVREKMDAQDRAAGGPVGVFQKTDEQPATARARERLTKQPEQPRQRKEAPEPEPERERQPGEDDDEQEQQEAQKPKEVATTERSTMKPEDAVCALQEIAAGEEAKLRALIHRVDSGHPDVKNEIKAAWGRVRSGGTK